MDVQSAVLTRPDGHTCTYAFPTVCRAFRRQTGFRFQTETGATAFKSSVIASFAVRVPRMLPEGGGRGAACLLHSRRGRGGVERLLSTVCEDDREQGPNAALPVPILLTRDGAVFPVPYCRRPHAHNHNCFLLLPTSHSPTPHGHARSPTTRVTPGSPPTSTVWAPPPKPSST